MNELDEDIKATADAIQADAATITAIEDEKIALDVDDPRVEYLSAEAVEVATRLVEEARVERELVVEAAHSETQKPSR
jgi:hypothetical protein